VVPFEPPFTQGLRDLGYVEGQNIVIERRYAREQRCETLPILAAELVRLQPAVIVTIGTAATRAAAGSIFLSLTEFCEFPSRGFRLGIVLPENPSTGIENHLISVVRTV
jgi:putative ABC transport system substrate-binding protein